MAQWCGADKHRSQTIKRAEWATTTGNSLGRRSWSAKNKKQIDRTIPLTDRRADHRHQQYHQLPHVSQHSKHRQTSHSRQRPINHVIRRGLGSRSFSQRTVRNVSQGAMFGPIPESNTPMDATATEANKKRKGMKSPAEEVPEGDSKLVMALARLALQRESERRAHARDDNVVFSMSSSGALARDLWWAADKYMETGAQLKKDQGENYTGHPIGKKPDASLPTVQNTPGHPHEGRRRQCHSPGALCGGQHPPGNEPEGSCHSDPASYGGAGEPTTKQFVLGGASSSSPRKTKPRSGLQRPLEIRN